MIQKNEYSQLTQTKEKHCKIIPNRNTVASQVHCYGYTSVRSIVLVHSRAFTPLPLSAAIVLSLHSSNSAEFFLAVLAKENQLGKPIHFLDCHLFQCMRNCFQHLGGRILIETVAADLLAHKSATMLGDSVENALGKIHCRLRLRRYFGLVIFHSAISELSPIQMKTFSPILSKSSFNADITVLSAPDDIIFGESSDALTFGAV